MKDVVGDGEMWSSILLFSACVSVMTVPAGLVLALNGWPLGWLLIVLTVPVIAVLFIVGNLIAKSDVAMLAAGVVGWAAGVVAVLMAWAGFGLLRFARDRRDAPTTSPEP